MAEQILLVRVGELHLKGLNRPFFLKALLRQINAAVSPLGGRAVHDQSRIYVAGLSDMDEAVRRVSRVFGVHSVSPALVCEKDLIVITEHAIGLMRGLKGSFKVDARRSDKTFPLDSPAIASELGYRVLSALPELSVDVHNPDHKLQVEIREKAYVLQRVVPAVGGMPVGTNGRVACLLSGGIDSPVAAYQVMKRGVAIEAVHFHSFPYTSEFALQKVRDLASVLADYHGPMRLHIVPFTDIQQQIHEKCPDSQITVIMRRFMMAISERIALGNDCLALVTGESIGQVASQTLHSIQCTDASVNLPVFRPLIGQDKIEIIAASQKIGTYDISIRPYEDCCTIFTPKHPVTHPALDRILESEKRLDVESLIADALSRTVVETIQSTET